MFGKQHVVAQLTHELTLLLKRNLICDITQVVTFRNIEYIPSYYVKKFNSITLSTIIGNIL